MNTLAVRIRRLIATLFFLGLGVLLPLLYGSLRMSPPEVFLPSHIPILLCGWFCGPFWGGLCALLYPGLSCLLTGAPAAGGIVPLMLELTAYGVCLGLLRKTMPLAFSLPLAMLAGRLVAALTELFTCLFTTGRVFSLPDFLSAAFAGALPGIALQLLIIPAVAAVFERMEKRR